MAASFYLESLEGELPRMPKRRSSQNSSSRTPVNELLDASSEPRAWHRERPRNGRRARR